MNNQINWDDALVEEARELALVKAKAAAMKAMNRLLLYFNLPIERIEVNDFWEARN